MKMSSSLQVSDGNNERLQSIINRIHVNDKKYQHYCLNLTFCGQDFLDIQDRVSYN